jgi:hypothetical protein
VACEFWYNVTGGNVSVDSCQVSNNLSLLIGIVAGGILAFYFFWKQAKIEKELAILSQKYVLRTAAFHLKDCFNGASYKGKSFTEADREKYARMLKREFIDKYRTKEEDILAFHRDAEKHLLEGELHPDKKGNPGDSPPKCIVCKSLAERAESILIKHKDITM